MALTFRTGSGGKGSALTIDELDNNFRHFTGSHDVSGSFEVTGSIILTGSFDIEGSLTASGDISASGDIFSDNITTNRDITVNRNLLVTASGGFQLASPNGTKYSFSINNDGHLSLTGSAV